MRWFEVLGGDFKKGGGNALFSEGFEIRSPGKLISESIPKAQIADVSLLREKTVKGDALCGAAVGALMMGIAGAALGSLVSGGVRKTVIFSCKLADGRQFVGEGSPQLFEQLSALVLKNKQAKEGGR
ncbi:MAG: hypothetical protein FWF41_00215 [Betaproteobacteria bacterium]|nr:hypothetical protein [Betaproteobacteria bacterium]